MEPESDLKGRPVTKFGVNSVSTTFYNSSETTDQSCDGNFEIQQISRPKYEDRFRVDRRKLEQLIVGALECADYAEDFFIGIMQETNTMIEWPRRLKMGAKTRKDPYVRIYGKASDVKEAKEKVLAVLDSKGSRTIMKLDISYTDHSHIIGKGGQTIRRVMEDTGCHIHFPDSNRSNPYEKSNQVSIAGEMEGVEQARQHLRMLTPVTFSFELPALSSVHSSPHPAYQIVCMVQERYNVHVIFRKGARLFSNAILVKGSEADLVKTETAARILMQHLCEAPEGEVPVQMTMEITPHHHMIVCGFNNSNLKSIMKQTSTTIIFPDTADPNLPPLKKSTVTISGSIHNVYLARQRLVGSLPLVLMFDVGEEEDVGIERCNEIMRQLEVEISVRLKPKYGTYSVCIKGVERNAGNLYKARQLLINSSEPAVKAEIPASYFPQEPSVKSPGTAVPKLLLDGAQPPASIPALSPVSSLSSTSSDWAFSNSNKTQSSTSIPHIGEKLNRRAMTLVCRTGQSEQDSSENLTIGTGLLHFAHNKSNIMDSYDKEETSPVSSNISSLSSPNRSPLNSPRSGSICFHGIDSGYGDTCESESSRPVSGIDSNQPTGKIASESFKVVYPDYDSMKEMAVKAMKGQPDASKLRVPITKWSGFGFSNSMPGSILKSCGFQSQMENSHLIGDGKEYGVAPVFKLDNKMDKICLPAYLPSMTMDVAAGHHKIKDNIVDIVSLLESIGLEKYSYMFTSQEIDMVTFMTLDDNDLRHLGIPTFGARQKILRAIPEVRKKYLFNGDAAPGAERKAGTSSHWDNYGC